MASILIPLAQGCEELEAVTLIDLLRRAEIEVTTASLDAGPITASRGVVLIADTTLDEALQHDYDMVVLPGGLPGADHLDNDPRIADLLKKMADSGKFTAAICAAPKVLANIGLLDGRSATSYPGVLDKMEISGMNYRNAAVVQDGKIITSRGPGTALDFALHLIEQLCDKTTRDQVEASLVRP
ncbi:DJ-1 family protein [Solemya pervernicosa gill symbiont]|uniref:DJ-1 family protein n=2 Tax=Gammaproteobacteria incertae sedis TaxID=118884 RepID=A0A1T2L3D3_9GAMM|nr:DJ-1 family glyoxalase III [Candidatus Reidiella endopervernicosa]OOZ39628.1 DJ-1 family protein [Solemya pervernicosa gill symbiont]QKQ25440.1 DJ-1/PfpI family protein [Candidatus Reidiella endopervernicosa]